jgi:hypothetical protein
VIAALLVVGGVLVALSGAPLSGSTLLALALIAAGGRLAVRR